MTILSGDIKVLASAVMDDVPEGGGRPTSAVILDGASNGVFPDISELDRAGGRVNLRKIFPAVRTANTDGYFGANVIVAEPYADPRVSVTLFSTGDVFDTRADAAARMESYLAKGPSYPGYLFGDHLAGQMSVTLLQRIEVAPPNVGDTLVLRKNESLPTQFDQFVRVTDVAAVERTFTDALGDFKRLQVNLDISDQLQADFNGMDALRQDSSINYTGKTKVSSTIVADAARYYGVVSLEQVAAIGDYTVRTAGIYTQLVPSTRVEVGIADARMNQQSAALVKAGEPYARSITMIFSAGSSMYVGGGILPSSLSVTRGGITVTDKGGVLVDQTGSQVGTVDYSNGVLALATSVWGTGAGTHAVTYTPAAEPKMVGESTFILVSAADQRLNYVTTLDPPPARGTLQISYRALGNWVVLTEDGSGAIRGGDSSAGAGTLNYSTGTVSVTLGSLPDVDSAVVFTFVAAAVVRPIEQLPTTGVALPRRFGKPVSLGKTIKPGTLSIAWNDGAARTATDAGGVLTGDATGLVNYAEGLIDFRPNLLPAKDTAVTVSITEATQVKNAVANFTDGGANWTATLPAPLKANSVELSVIVSYLVPDNAEYWFRTGETKTVSLRLFDNGSGGLLFANIDGNTAVGTVNYATGAVSIPKTISGFKVEVPTYFFVNGVGARKNGYAIVTGGATVANGPGAGSVPAPTWAWWGGAQANALEARYSGNDGTGSSHPFLFDSIFLPANPNGYGATSGFSLEVTAFELGASRYNFRASDNAWLRDTDPATGTGTVAGAKAVLGGQSGVLISAWQAGAASTPTGVAGATQPDLNGDLLIVDQASFRTAVAPLVNSGFQVAGNFAVSGAGFTATAASNGNVISGTAVVGTTPGSYGVFGQVDFEMGLANLYFGRRVPATMAAEPYVVDLSALALPGVQYVELYAAKADTLRYNATAYSYLPLDPSILGLNPVRLPADGRVPIFRPGTFAVIGHTGTVGPTTAAAGNTINAGRTRLSRWRVIGENGAVIHTGYTEDLDAGTLTVTDVTGWDQPVKFEHRIEDLVQVSDAQINGQLTFTRPVTHNYPLDSYVSSALVLGDVRARVSLVFDQATWSNTWAGSASGSSAGGTFDHVGSPITVSNLGALTERWAVVFKSSTTFEVVGEHVGIIATGNTGVDCSPMNPAAGAAYLSIPAAGWGLGWVQGNVLRIDTVGAAPPVWAARTILAGPETVIDDSFTLLVRGDVDRP